MRDDYIYSGNPITALLLKRSQLLNCSNVLFPLHCHAFSQLLYMILVIYNVCIIFCVPLSLFFILGTLRPHSHLAHHDLLRPLSICFRKYVHRSAVLGRLFISLSSGTNHLKHCLSTWALVVPRERLCNQ